MIQKKSNGRVKKYKRRSVNLGKPGDPARAIVERLEQTNPGKVSHLINKAIVRAYGDQHGDATNIQVDGLIYRFIELGREIVDIGDSRAKLRKQAEIIGGKSLDFDLRLEQLKEKGY